MSIRAKRLAKYLEDNLGWQVYDDTKTCSCGKKLYGKENKYCSICGLKLKNNSQPPIETIQDLEEALKYALNGK